MYIFILSVCCFVIIISFFKSGHFIINCILSVFQGLSALFAVNFIGGFTGLHLSVNVFSLLVSCISGLPGVIFLTVSNLISVLL